MVADCCLVSIDVATGVSLVDVALANLTSECCLLQHKITSNFYATVSHKLNASVNKPNKARVPSLNPKQSEISPSNGAAVYNLCKMLVSTQRRELL